MNEMNTQVRASNEALTELVKKRSQASKSIFIILIGAFFLFLPPIGIIIIFYGISRSQKIQREMKELYKDAFVREPLANNFDNVVYEPNQGFSVENVKDFRLCLTGNSFYSEDYIRASYQGVPFEMAEVRAYDVDKSDDSSRSTTYFEGRMIVFNFPNKLVNSVSVFGRKFKHRDLSRREEKETKVELESMQFNNDFDVYSQIQQDAFYLITPQFMDRLGVLAGKYESIAMNVVGSRVALAFNEPGKNAFDADVPIGQVDVDKEMAKVQAEIDDIKLFISLILNLRTYG